MVKVEDLERFHIQDHAFLRLPKRKKTLNVQIHHDFFYYYFEQAHNHHHLKNENNFLLVSKKSKDFRIVNCDPEIIVKIKTLNTFDGNSPTETVGSC